MIEIASSDAHSCLFAAIFVVGDARLRADLLEALAREVVVVQIWRGITRYVDVRPPVIVEIRDQRGESVATLGTGQVSLIRDVSEVSVAVVLIKRYAFRR